LPGLDVFLGIEAREMLTNDLLGPVLLDPFGAGIPGDDAAFGVEHEDRVVFRAFDQETERLFGRPELLGSLLDLAPQLALEILLQPLQLSPLGGVPEDHDDAEDGLLVILDRRRAVVDGTLRAVPTDQHGVVPKADDDTLPQRPGDGALDRLARLLVQ